MREAQVYQARVGKWADWANGCEDVVNGFMRMAGFTEPELVDRVYGCATAMINDAERSDSGEIILRLVPKAGEVHLEVSDQRESREVPDIAEETRVLADRWESQPVLSGMLQKAVFFVERSVTP